MRKRRIKLKTFAAPTWFVPPPSLSVRMITKALKLLKDNAANPPLVVAGQPWLSRHYKPKWYRPSQGWKVKGVTEMPKIGAKIAKTQSNMNTKAEKERKPIVDLQNGVSPLDLAQAANAVRNGFNWSKMPQGKDFWLNVWRSLSLLAAGAPIDKAADKRFMPSVQRNEDEASAFPGVTSWDNGGDWIDRVQVGTTPKALAEAASTLASISWATLPGEFKTWHMVHHILTTIAGNEQMKAKKGKKNGTE